MNENIDSFNILKLKTKDFSVQTKEFLKCIEKIDVESPVCNNIINLNKSITKTRKSKQKTI